MTSGFGAIFDDLHQTASRITDVVTGADGLPWEGPSGDYGHSGVQAGWAQFMESARTQVQGLWDRANEHSELVRSAAGLYQESDEEKQQTLSGIGAALNPGNGAEGLNF